MQIETVSPDGGTAGVPAGRGGWVGTSTASHPRGPGMGPLRPWAVNDLCLFPAVRAVQGREEKAEGREGSPRRGLYLAKVRELPDGEVSTEGHTADLELGQEGEKAERLLPGGPERNWMSQSGGGQRVGRAEGGAVRRKVLGNGQVLGGRRRHG